MNVFLLIFMFYSGKNGPTADHASAIASVVDLSGLSDIIVLLFPCLIHSCTTTQSQFSVIPKRHFLTSTFRLFQSYFQVLYLSRIWDIYLIASSRMLLTSSLSTNEASRSVSMLGFQTRIQANIVTY